MASPETTDRHRKQDDAVKDRLTTENILKQLWGSLLMSTVLSIVMPLAVGAPLTVSGFIEEFILSYIASMALKLITPIIPWASILASRLGFRERTVSHRLASSLFLAFMMGTCMSLLITWWGIHRIENYHTIFLSSWLRAYPWVILTVYVLINISIPTGNYLVGMWKIRTSDA